MEKNGSERRIWYYIYIYIKPVNLVSLVSGKDWCMKMWLYIFAVFKSKQTNKKQSIKQTSKNPNILAQFPIRYTARFGVITWVFQNLQKLLEIALKCCLLFLIIVSPFKVEMLVISSNPALSRRFFTEALCAHHPWSSYLAISHSPPFCM